MEEINPVILKLRDKILASPDSWDRSINCGRYNIVNKNLKYPNIVLNELHGDSWILIDDSSKVLCLNEQEIILLRELFESLDRKKIIVQDLQIISKLDECLNKL